MKKYYDEFGLTKILTDEQLFKFLQIKGYIPHKAEFDDWKNKLHTVVENYGGKKNEVHDYRKSCI